MAELPRMSTGDVTLFKLSGSSFYFPQARLSEKEQKKSWRGLLKAVREFKNRKKD
jgi:hypothetical protein